YFCYVFNFIYDKLCRLNRIMTENNENTTGESRSNDMRSRDIVVLVQSLTKPKLLALCKELGLEGRNADRKPTLVARILECDAGDDEVSECYEELERLSISSEPRSTLASSQDTTSPVDSAPVRLSLKELIRPYEMGSDMLLYLVNFERVCEQAAISRNMWSSHL